MKRYCSLCLLSAIGILLGAAPAAADKPPCSVKQAKASPASQTIAEGQPVSINGKDGDDRVTYTWVQSDGPAVTPTRSDEKLEFIAPQVGNGGATLVFQLTVACAGTQASTTATVLVTNLNVNHPPVPQISEPPSPVYEGSAVTLDGTSSSDPDGDVLTYSWSQLEGPAVTLADANTASASFAAPAVGPAGVSLTFRLEVSDGFLSAGTNVVINVVNVNQPPQVSVTCPANVNEGDSVSLVASASDDDEVASYSWTHVDGAPSITATDTFSPTLDFTAPSLSLGQAGLLTFNILVKDNEGLAADATCQVQINDVTPPVLDLPADIIAEATSPDGAVVSFTASAEDAHDGAVEAICTPASGSTFALGLTTVNCSSKDSANNEATGSFSVTVQDTTPPELTLPADLTVEATGPSGAVATFAPTASDLVDGDVDVSCTPASGSVFNLGTNAVSCSATDAHGNTATGSFAVTVQDTTPPSFGAHPDRIVIYGSAGTPPYYVAPVATDLVDSQVSVNCVPGPLANFGFGATTVTCTATDAHSNTSTVQFQLTVAFAPAGLCLAGPGHQVLQPIALTGSSVFKQSGSTVPVKFRVCDAAGNSYHATNPVTAFQLIQVGSGTVASEANTDAVTTYADTAFRWSESDQFWIFNLSTKGYAPATTYVFRITLLDGSAIQFQFGIK